MSAGNPQEKPDVPSEGGVVAGVVASWDDLWVTGDRADAARKIRDVLSPLLRRDPDTLAAQLCVGPPGHCAELPASEVRPQVVA